jgi:hypothetical protein
MMEFGGKLVRDVGVKWFEGTDAPTTHADRLIAGAELLRQSGQKSTTPGE